MRPAPPSPDPEDGPAHDPRSPFDAAAYRRRTALGCFICRMLAGEPDFEHEVLHRDDEHVVFLNRWPTTLGQLLVAPVEHRERFESDLDEDAFARLQRLVHRASRALASVVPVERVDTASLGSAQANRHVHVHVAALPPGTPAEQQQLAALDAERAGVLVLLPERTARLAADLRAALARTDRRGGA